MTTPVSRAGLWAGYNGRISALEIGRGVAILSVIYGHALAPWFMAAGADFSEGAFLQWKFGASFMMVFFFFLSGVGWREDKSFTTTLRQALSLIVITLAASAIFDVVRLVATFGGFAAALGLVPLDPLHFLRGVARMTLLGDLYSLSALWFLVALAIVRIIAALFVQCGRGPLIMMSAVLLALMMISWEAGWRNIYQINLLGFAFAAFIAGHFMRDAVHALERKPRAAYALLLIAGAVTLATFHLNEGCRWDMAAQCGQGWLGDRFGVSMMIGQFGNLPLFTFTAIAGIGFALALSILLARFGGVVGAKLDSWGRNSLNLLIVNSVFLQAANPLVAAWIKPLIDADNILFFAGLFAITLIANLLVVGALERPLRALATFSNKTARKLVAIAERASSWAAVALRRDRVSQVND